MSLVTGRDVDLGEGDRVRRLLPTRALRTVGAWCFADHFGPDDVTTGVGLRVGPHPHCGLQTVTWLREGAVRHLDSLGNDAVVRPGEVSLMTAGHGISHAEESPVERPPTLHGVQLWIALPPEARDTTPAYEHLGELPTAHHGDLRVTVFVGSHAGLTAPGRVWSDLVGADLSGSGLLPLDPAREHALLPLVDGVTADGQPLPVGSLLHLEPGRTDVEVDGELVLLGGVPLAQRPIVWWNLVAGQHDEVVAARAAWEAGERFGTVQGAAGARVPAPPAPTSRLLAR